jgi:hypothetical protein
MFGADNSLARAKRVSRSLPFGKNVVTGASTVAIAAAGLLFASPQAVAAELATCEGAQSNYRTALTHAATGDGLREQVTSAAQKAVQLQVWRAAQVAAAVVDAAQARSDVEQALKAAAERQSDLESANEALQSALASARAMADRVYKFEDLLDEQRALNAADVQKAQTQLDDAAAAQSLAASAVMAAYAALSAAKESRDPLAIGAAEDVLSAAQKVLEGAEADAASAKIGLQNVRSDGWYQLQDIQSRLDETEQDWWQVDELLMRADNLLRSADTGAHAAAAAVEKAQAGLLAAQNEDEIAAADTAIVAAGTTARALMARIEALPSPASIASLWRTSVEACTVPTVTVQRQPPVQAEPVGALVPTAKNASPAPAAIPFADPEQKNDGSAAANRGLNVGTGMVFVPTQQAPSGTGGQDRPTVGWTLAGLLLLAATSLVALCRGFRERSIVGRFDVNGSGNK